VPPAFFLAEIVEGLLFRRFSSLGGGRKGLRRLAACP
jgi:hypothetical protein